MRQLLIFIFSTLLFSGCMYVDPKEVVLRVHELGDNAGEITIYTIPGRYGPAGWEATDFKFPTTEQNYRWTETPQEDYGSDNDEAIQLQIEGNNCKIDVGIRFYVDNTNEAGLRHLVTKYPTDLDGIVDGLLYDIVRGAIKEEVMGRSLDNVIDTLPALIRGPVAEKVSKDAEPYAIKIVEVYDISGLNAPKSVMDRKMQTQEANEEIEKARKRQEEQAIVNATLLDKVRADSMATVIKAQSEAAANRIRNANPPSPAVLDQMKIEKWNGVEAPGSDVILMAKEQ